MPTPELSLGETMAEQMHPIYLVLCEVRELLEEILEELKKDGKKK
jgi:hypothetical protein